MSAEERDQRFARLDRDPSRLTLVATGPNDETIAYIAWVQIDWHARRVGNLAIRVHPASCDQGLGTRILRAMTEWAFGQGMNRMTLDVAASNARAIRCYEKVGFQTVGELWRPAADLADVDLSDSRYDFVRPHVRRSHAGTELRFFVMRIERGIARPGRRPDA